MSVNTVICCQVAWIIAGARLEVKELGLDRAFKLFAIALAIILVPFAILATVDHVTDLLADASVWIELLQVSASLNQGDWVNSQALAFAAVFQEVLLVLTRSLREPAWLQTGAVKH